MGVYCEEKRRTQTDAPLHPGILLGYSSQRRGGGARLPGMRGQVRMFARKRERRARRRPQSSQKNGPLVSVRGRPAAPSVLVSNTHNLSLSLTFSYSPSYVKTTNGRGREYENVLSWNILICSYTP